MCEDSYNPRNLRIKAKPWFVAYGCFIEDIELGSHLSIKANISGPKVTALDRFHCTTKLQVLWYWFCSVCMYQPYAK